MDKLRRALLGQIAKLTAGAALVPLSSFASAGINDQPPRREGDPSKRYAMLIDLRACIGCQACTVSCHIENEAPLAVSVRLFPSTRWSMRKPATLLRSCCRACVTTATTRLACRFAR